MTAHEGLCAWTASDCRQLTNPERIWRTVRLAGPPELTGPVTIRVTHDTAGATHRSGQASALDSSLPANRGRETAPVHPRMCFKGMR
jgi:hypothetical protein